MLFNFDQIIETTGLFKLVFELFLWSNLRLWILLLQRFLPPQQIYLLNAHQLLLLGLDNLLLGVALVGGVVVRQI